MRTEPTPEPPTVLDLIENRSRNGSRPGKRLDGLKLGLVIEGGGMRGVVGGGMISALEVLGLGEIFDSVYGTSAGSITGAYFVSGQARFGTTVYYENINNTSFINLRHILGSAPVMSLEFLLDHVCIREKPLAVEKILNGRIPLVATATSLTDQTAHGLTDFRNHSEIFEALRCSARIPWVAGEPVLFRGERYVDGGVTESIPYRIAAKDGCTHVLALLTRPQGVLRTPAGLLDKYVIAPWLNNRAKGLGDLYLQRSEEYLDEIDFLQSRTRQAEAGLAALPVQIVPELRPVDTLEKRRSVLVDGAKAGFQAVYRTLGRAVPDVLELLHPLEKALVPDKTKTSENVEAH